MPALCSGGGGGRRCQSRRTATQAMSATVVTWTTATMTATATMSRLQARWRSRRAGASRQGMGQLPGAARTRRGPLLRLPWSVACSGSLPPQMGRDWLVRLQAMRTRAAQKMVCKVLRKAGLRRRCSELMHLLAGQLALRTLLVKRAPPLPPSRHSFGRNRRSWIHSGEGFGGSSRGEQLTQHRMSTRQRIPWPSRSRLAQVPQPSRRLPGPRQHRLPAR